MTKKEKIAKHKKFWKNTLLGNSVKKLHWKTYDQYGSVMIDEITLNDGTVLRIAAADSICVIIK